MAVDALNCPNCGAGLKSGSATCAYCGSALQVSAPAGAPGAGVGGYAAPAGGPGGGARVDLVVRHGAGPQVAAVLAQELRLDLGMVQATLGRPVAAFHELPAADAERVAARLRSMGVGVDLLPPRGPGGPPHGGPPRGPGFGGPPRGPGFGGPPRGPGFGGPPGRRR